MHNKVTIKNMFLKLLTYLNGVLASQMKLCVMVSHYVRSNAISSLALFHTSLNTGDGACPSPVKDIYILAVSFQIKGVLKLG